MAWRTMEVREQRVKFVVAAERKEKSMESLCAEFGISRPTGYLWLKRYRAEGLTGISERSRRPRKSPNKTAEQLEERVKETRTRYPDWGARKLGKVLGDDGVALTASTIHRILLRHDLVREEDRHAQAVKRFEKSRANELWQMDFKGPKGWTHPVGPLVVLDDYSRYLIAGRRPRYTDGGCEGAFRERISTLRLTGSDADGSRSPVVEHAVAIRPDQPFPVADATRYPAIF